MKIMFFYAVLFSFGMKFRKDFPGIFLDLKDPPVLKGIVHF